MLSSFSDNSGMIWSGGGRDFRQPSIEEREGGQRTSVVTEMEFFRVRVRGERLSEARGKTAGHVSFSTETEGCSTVTYENSFQVVCCVDRSYGVNQQ